MSDKLYHVELWDLAVNDWVMILPLNHVHKTEGFLKFWALYRPLTRIRVYKHGALAHEGFAKDWKV